MKKLCGIIVLLALVSLGWAQESTWSATETILTKDGKFCAILNQDALGRCQVEVKECSYDFTVWTAWIEWKKGYAIRLSDDGRIVAVVNDVYSAEASLVTIYTESGQKAYSIKSIAIKRIYLKSRNNALVWITDLGENIRFKYDEGHMAKSLELSLVDGRSLSIDLP